MKRPVASRVRESIDKYVPIIKSLEPKFQEFSDLIDLVKLVVSGLAKYHWWFTSDEHRKLILTMRKEDDYSRNVTLIGRQLRICASSPELTLRQKKFLDRLDYILGLCLQEAFELFEESERELVREGIKIHMDASDGYGEHERKNAALWTFQKEFHKRQLDSGRGSDKAIIYPPAGFDNYGLSVPGTRGRDDDRGTMTDEVLLGLKKFVDSLNNPDALRDLLNGNVRNPDCPPVMGDNRDDRNIAPPVIPPPTIPTKPPIGILKGGTSGFGPPRDTGKKFVHWQDSDDLPLPSPGASGSPPAGSIVETVNKPPNLPDIFSTPSTVPGPHVQNGLPPLIAIPTPTFGPPSNPISPSPSHEEPSPPPFPWHVVDATDPTASNSTNDPTVPGAAELETPNHQPPPTSPSPSSSSSLPSVGSPNPTKPSSGTVDKHENTSSPDPPMDAIEALIETFLIFVDIIPSTGDGDENYISPKSLQDDIEVRLRNFLESLDTMPSTGDGIGNTNMSKHDIEVRIREVLSRVGLISSANATLAKMEVEVRRELALSIRAYLGRRHDEYGMALSALSTRKDAKREDEREKPLYLSHPSLVPIVRQRNSSGVRDVKTTALLHWSGVAKTKRQERINGYTRLRAVLKWAEKEGKVPLSPSSIRASTGLRRGLFEQLGSPDLSLVRKHERENHGPGPYREATLANLAEMQPRLGLTLPAFLFNQDALRLFGGLVGERPQPRDLGRMDKLLRELEVYTAVCKHRKDLIVCHLKQTREFPTAMGAQFGDLQAALLGAEEDHLSAAQRCFTHVAERSRRVMTYPGKRRMREFSGSLGPQDREKLEHLSEIDDGAEALQGELERAEEWFDWCRDAIDKWTKGWRPDTVEKDMLYVGEDTQADLRRYKWEINQKRAAIELAPVERPQDEVYERQQEHIQLLDRLWSLTGLVGTGQ